MTGTGTPSAIEPTEDQGTEVGVTVNSGLPVDRRDLGATADADHTARAREVQMPRGDQPKGYGTGQPRQQHSKDQPKGYGAGPRHQQHPQDQRRRRLQLRRQPRPPAPPQAAPEQLGAAASTGDAAKAGEAQVAQERASQELDRTQRAALLEQAEEVAARLKELMAKLAGTGVSPLAYKTGQEDQLMAAILQMVEPANQPAPDIGSREPAVAVGVLRAEEPEDESQWRCKVTTCSGSYHLLIRCPPFLQMPAEERGELVALSDLCRGCLTPGHGTTVRGCPVGDKLDGLCAKIRCKLSHHWLLHVDGKQSRCPHQYLGGDAAVSKQRYAQAAATMVHAVHQPPVQLVTQRIRTAAGESCLAFWDSGSQVTLTTHKAAREMGLEPIPGPTLNLMGVGDSQKTRSTVRYKVSLVDTGGRTVEVAQTTSWHH
jgi:hypothetical protein